MLLQQYINATQSSIWKRPYTKPMIGTYITTVRHKFNAAGGVVNTFTLIPKANQTNKYGITNIRVTGAAGTRTHLEIGGQIMDMMTLGHPLQEKDSNDEYTVPFCVSYHVVFINGLAKTQPIQVRSYQGAELQFDVVEHSYKGIPKNIQINLESYDEFVMKRGICTYKGIGPCYSFTVKIPDPDVTQVKLTFETGLFRTSVSLERLNDTTDVWQYQFTSQRNYKECPNLSRIDRIFVSCGTKYNGPFYTKIGTFNQLGYIYHGQGQGKPAIHMIGLRFSL